jgi:hypothetical protein
VNECWVLEGIVLCLPVLLIWFTTDSARFDSQFDWLFFRTVSLFLSFKRMLGIDYFFWTGILLKRADDSWFTYEDLRSEIEDCIFCIMSFVYSTRVVGISSFFWWKELLLFKLVFAATSSVNTLSRIRFPRGSDWSLWFRLLTNGGKNYSFGTI